MSELINNSQKRKELLKHMILQLHEGEAPEIVRNRLVHLLQSVPYGEVVEVEQELIFEGLPEEEVIRFCNIHSMVLEGHIDQQGAKQVPPGHPVDTFKKENIELEHVINEIDLMLSQASNLSQEEIKPWQIQVHGLFNNLMDVDKHYKRKEYLVFPFLEKYEITGPPKVMWGKHDETRDLLKAAIEAVSIDDTFQKEEIKTLVDLVLKPATNSVLDMIMKEEEILLPMCMDRLTEEDWYHVYQQTIEFGFCLYDPQEEWTPEGVEITSNTEVFGNDIQLPTGSFSAEELFAVFSTMPMDITFVDKNDKVKFFSLGPERIFSRNRAILGRDVRMCHPPSSVHIVDQILDDFKQGKENSAAFWINMHGRFIHIEYFAMRGKYGEYLGTMECTQDLTQLRLLEGEQRLLSYEKNQHHART